MVYTNKDDSLILIGLHKGQNVSKIVLLKNWNWEVLSRTFSLWLDKSSKGFSIKTDFSEADFFNRNSIFNMVRLLAHDMQWFIRKIVLFNKTSDKSLIIKNFERRCFNKIWIPYHTQMLFWNFIIWNIMVFKKIK